LDQANKIGCRPIHKAIVLGKMNCIKLLVEAKPKGANINAKWIIQDRWDITPLHLAIYLTYKNLPNAIDIFHYLVKQGADIDAVGYFNDVEGKMKIEPMKDILTFEDDRKLEDDEIRLRLNRLNLTKDALTWRTLMKAVKNGNSLIVEKSLLLLKNTSSLSWLDTVDAQENRTALHWAAHNRDAESVSKLLKYGASTKIKDSNDQTPSEIAKGEEYEDILELCEKADKAKKLEEKMISILSKDPLFDNHSKLRDEFKEFIEKEAMLDIQYTIDGNTPLHSFVAKGFKKFAKMLLEMGANVNIQNDQGDTPLHLAVTAGDSLMVKEIFQRNPNLNLQNKRKKTVVNIINDIRNKYKKYLPLDLGFDETAMINDSTPLDEAWSPDMNDEDIAKKSTSENQKEEKSVDSVLLTLQEELDIEKKVFKSVTTQFPNCTPEDFEKHVKNFTEKEKELKLKQKELNLKQIEVNKSESERKKKQEEEAEIERERKEKVVPYYFSEKIKETIQGALDYHEYGRFIQDWYEKRQNTLRKHQHSARTLERLRELLDRLCQGGDDDEFNYKEVIAILQTLGGGK